MSPPIDIDRFERLKASGELPSPRGVALAIIRLTRQDEVSIAELARVISGDPAFVGRVVKAANGLISFGRRPVVSVHEALMVLGLPAVRSMALGFSLLSDYRNGGCKAFDYNDYWAGSLALALAMQALAQRTRAAAPDELFSLGLLLRVGELAFATLYPDDYANVLENQRGSQTQDLAEVERQAFAMTHSDLGVAMLTDWGLPRVFVELVEYYDRPEASAYDEGSRQHVLIEALGVARQFAEICIADELSRPRLLAPLLARTGRMGLNRDDVLADCARIYRLWGEWGELLQLDMLAAPAFPEAPEASGDEDEGDAQALRSAFSVTTDASGAEPVQPREAAVAIAATPIRVLVIEHAEVIRDTLEAMLRDDGVEVLVHDGANSPLECVIEAQPRMMVVGRVEPAADALRFVQSLRELRLGQPIHVLLLTDGEGEEFMVDAFESGVDDCVPRSASQRVLAVRIEAGLREARLQQELEREREELRRYAVALGVKNRQLQEMALTDALTGFRNRRYAIDRISQEWAAVERDGRPLSCMVMDLDGLKEINDSFGHDVGDEALKRAAEALRGVLRGQDVICRTGGDEFLAICPGSGLSAAMACAERLRQSVSRIVLEVDGRSVAVSVSIGVAERDRSTKDIDMLMKLADQGAYLAKERGRNLVAAIQREGA